MFIPSKLKEYREVTLVYSDEVETLVAASTEPTILPVDISFEYLSTKQKECPYCKFLPVSDNSCLCKQFEPRSGVTECVA